ncbi:MULTISPECIES: ribonuclease P protein component [unclassified Dehalobacter]|uniref:ribonuclease P protein component n=1 Tax=unclassified Dehalobacter TaxID=2635733 RepID=UPI000E6D336D|nr:MULTISPECIES: ribonuclease P protein component [unclassified Dehalobacter]RJE47358.1 ribonuclease P protein component [Dehalobacter sp. MCB1]TCX48834.1 ribonuclease P protein component [Dehalobacter sp. 14DCB1]TCX56118.1 ribonuclease P protein component [Dehalobacter sp. 12DCB1]
MLLKSYRLKNKADFQSVFTNGKSYTSRQVVIYIFRGNNKKFGFIASKKVGNAVKRNRAKRLMREAVRLNIGGLKTDCEMILIARTAINKATLQEVEKSVLYIWRKAGIYDGKNA